MHRKFIIALLVGIAVFSPFYVILVSGYSNVNISTVYRNTDDGIKIAFDLYLTEETNTSSPIAILIHGFSGNRRMMNILALSLVEKDFIAVTIDLRGHGDSEGSMATSNNFIADVKTVIDFLDINGIGNVSNLVLIGHSMGGGVSFNYSKYDSSIVSTIGICPAAAVSDVNTTNPKNLLLITSTGDNIVPSDGVFELFYKSINNTGEQGIIYNINGTLRKLYVDQSSDHLNILYKTEVVNEVVKWATLTALGSEETLSINPDLIGVSVLFSLIGGVIIILSSIPLIYERIVSNKTSSEKVEEKREKIIKKLIIGFILESLVGAALSLLFTFILIILSPLFITDFLTALFLGNSLSLGLYAFWEIRKNEKNKSFIKFIKNSIKTKTIGLDIIIGSLVGIFLVLLFYATIGTNTMSTFAISSIKLLYLPLFIILYGIIFLSYEIFFRGLILPKLGNSIKSISLVLVIQIAMILPSVIIQLLISSTILQQNISFLILGLPQIVLLIVLTTFASTIFFKKNHGWISQILTNALIFSALAVTLSNIIYLF